MNPESSLQLEGYIPLEEALQRFPVPESGIRYTHSLCPDLELIAGQDSRFVNLGLFGLTIPYPIDVIGDGFSISDEFRQNLDEMFASAGITRTSDLPPDHFLVAELRKYWQLCKEKSDGYTSEAVTGETLSNDHIDCSMNKIKSAPYSVDEVRQEVDSNLKVLDRLLELSEKYVSAGVHAPELWALYKATNNPHLEDRLISYYSSAFDGAPSSFADFKYVLRVAAITYDPGHVRQEFLRYANDIWKGVRRIRTRMKKEFLAKEGIEAFNQFTVNSERYALQLCRTLSDYGHAEGLEPEPSLDTKSHAALRERLKGLLSPGELAFIDMRYNDDMSYKDMEGLFSLPASLLKEIHQSILRKISVGKK